MSRTIKDIYSEAIYVRNNYLQITELDSGRTKSKMSIMNLMTYVMAVLIYSYEVVLDAFQVNVAKLILARINGTPAWYVNMAYKFQYSDNSQDHFGFNESTYMLEYDEVNEQHRIISKAAYQEYTDDSIILKVCKNNSDSGQVGNGMLYMPLSNISPNDELTVFKQYIQSIKFVGSRIHCISLKGDLVAVKSNGAVIWYNDAYDNEDGILEKIKVALVNYAKSLEYNSFVYYQSFIDAIQSVKNVVSIDAGIVVEVRAYNSLSNQYDAAENIIGQYRPLSGYIGYIDENGDSTITKYVEGQGGNLILKGISGV